MVTNNVTSFKAEVSFFLKYPGTYKTLNFKPGCKATIIAYSYELGRNCTPRYKTSHLGTNFTPGYKLNTWVQNLIPGYKT
jgi:hypothetical protein